MDLNTLCQSCAMPMEADMYGTNADGEKSAHYCKYCYDKGAFTSDSTMQQMIDTCIPHMTGEGSGMTEAQAREIMEGTLPQLKRWKA